MLTFFSFTAKKAIWFTGDKYLRKAFQVTVDNPDCFHQLGNFELMETCFLAVMFFEHVTAAVLELFNTLQYVLQFIVVHEGASDFSKFNNL